MLFFTRYRYIISILKNKSILVLGLGNPILGDDGVGWHVAKLVQQQLPSLSQKEGVVEIDFISVGGLSLMERMVGYKHVILIDAMTGQDKPLGTLSVAALRDLPNNSQGRLCSAHDVSLQNALEVGKLSGAQVPEQITVIGIEAQAVYDFSDQLSPIIEQVVSEAAQCVINLIFKEI